MAFFSKDRILENNAIFIVLMALLLKQQEVKRMAVTYHQYISSPLWEGRRYGTGQFYSPLKDMREQAGKVLEGEFADRLWDTYMQASDMAPERYRQISAYREISSFLQKATNGQYKWEDIYRDTDKSGNVKIAGLPGRLCELLNSQESNGKYEQLRDDIFLLWSAQGWTENSSQTAKNWTDFRVKYQSNGTEMLRRKNTDV